MQIPYNAFFVLFHCRTAVEEDESTGDGFRLDVVLQWTIGVVIGGAVRVMRGCTAVSIAHEGSVPF
jgi:hypothetical protein